MSAFGVILVGVGILMVWSTVHGNKINDVFKAFYANPDPKVQTSSAVVTSGSTQGSLA